MWRPRSSALVLVLALAAAAPAAAAGNQAAAASTQVRGPGRIARVGSRLRQLAARPIRALGVQLGVGADQDGVPVGTSTPLQRGLVAAQVGASALAVHALQLHLDRGWKYAAGAGLVYFGYQVADAVGGVVHWALDNYGDEHTPVMGTQIRDFQTHHARPWLAGKRSIPDLMAPLTLVATPFMLSLTGMSHSSWALQAGLLGFGIGFVLNPIGHKFAHRANVGPVVKTLRRLGIFIEPKEHVGGHHRAPFSRSYGVMSGQTNRFTDGVKLHRRLEALVYRTTGAVPNTWKEPGGEAVMVDALGSDPSKHPHIDRSGPSE